MTQLELDGGNTFVKETFHFLDIRMCPQPMYPQKKSTFEIGILLCFPMFALGTCQTWIALSNICHRKYIFPVL